MFMVEQFEILIQEFLDPELVQEEDLDAGGTFAEDG